MFLDTHNHYRNFIQKLKLSFCLNTTCEIQLADQSVIAAIKQYYMRRLINQAVRATDREGVPTLK
jgi:hypothetical protein